MDCKLALELSRENILPVNGCNEALIRFGHFLSH